jgi:hypothetical protein
MKTTAHKVKLDIPRDVFIQTDCFDVNKANIIVVALYAEIFFAGTH